MSRTAAILVYLVALLALTVGVAVIVFPGESLWLMLALAPAALLAMLVVNLRPAADGTLRLSQPSPPPTQAVRSQNLRPARASSAPPGPAVRHPHDQAQVWNGTMRLRPNPSTLPVFVPVQLALSRCGRAARLGSFPVFGADRGLVTFIDVAEQDASQEVVFLRVGVKGGDPITVGLRRNGDRLVSVDESASLVAEFHRDGSFVV